MEKKNGYIRISDPNKEELARLLKKAKGDGRSMRQFASECGVNQSTFSRIVNKRFTGASSDKLIVAIAEHADPESGVTLDALMAAHGKAKIVDNTTVSRLSAMEIEKRFNYAIIHELKKAGDLPEWVNNMKFSVGTTLRYVPDIIVRSKLIEGSSDLWAFELFVQQQTIFKKENDSSTTRDCGLRILDKMGRILPMFYRDKESAGQIGKFSFVITDKEIFNYIKAEFANYYVPFNTSFILFDIDRDVIEQEFVLKKPGGFISNSVFDGNEADS